MAKESNIDKALRLHSQAEAAKKAAIADLLEERRAIDAKLAQLGHVRRALRGRREKRSAKKAAAPRAAARVAKACPVCQKTGHDGRRHRWDKAKKQA